MISITNHLSNIILIKEYFIELFNYSNYLNEFMEVEEIKPHLQYLFVFGMKIVFQQIIAAF